jgi:cyclopropane-fatty-acyl-phospholipid synthase
LHHLIVSATNAQDRRWHVYKRSSGFIQKHIFPGGMRPSPKASRDQIERARLGIVKSAAFGLSYSLTLRRWRETFNQKWDRAVALGFDERFRRM